MVKPQKPLARLEARVDAEIKAKWQQAADLQGITLTDFAIASLQDSADRVIQQHQRMKLTAEDTEAFVDALLNPSEPNENLRLAVAEYQQIMGD